MVSSLRMDATPRLVVSAPFGNYVQPQGALATLGTFTAARRPGRIWRILKTVRWYPRIGGWVNKIGLRNPGIDWLVEKARVGRIDLSDKLVSIHGFSDADWYLLLERIAELAPRGVELNLSCPNVGAIEWPEDLFERAVATRVPVVAKLPPVQYELLFEQALAAGIRTFHCCNTLPVPAGGISGSPLEPVALACIRRLPELAPAEVAGELRILGGGGIKRPEDVDDYARAPGVVAVAVGTKVMNPAYLFSTGGLAGIRARAEELLGSRAPWLSGVLAAGGAALAAHP